MSRVIAIKGVTGARAIIGSPTPVDVTVRGKKFARGYKVWPVGVDMAKSELYGWLGLPMPSLEKGEPYPSGYCHFPEYGEDFFKQITAEHLVSSTTRKGYTQFEWQVQPGRENHWLDARIYARVAAALIGLDRMAPKQPVVAVAAISAERSASVTPPAPVLPPQRPERKAFLSDSRFSAKGKSWLGR